MALDDAAQGIAEELGRSIVIFDTELNVIAFSIHEGAVDRGRLGVILARKATPIAAQMIAESKAKSANAPVLLPAHDDVPARVLMPLRHNGRLSGYLSYSEPDADESTLTEKSSLLRHASERLGTLIALHNIDRQHQGDVLQRLVADLLDPLPEVRSAAAGSLITKELISEAEQYSVMLLRSRDESLDQPTPKARLAVEDALAFVAKSTTLRAAGAVLGAEGIVVIPRPANRDRLERLLDNDSLRGVTGGLGTTRRHLSDVIESYRESRIAWQATNRLPQSHGRVAHWENLGLDRILLQLPFESIRREDMPPSILKLLGVQSGFDLASTLDCYLRCGGDAQETARTLHIHRSTLYYRLDRIRELIGEDLSDGTVRRELHSGLHIAKLAGFWSGP
jgi:PucR C-terminal helix-turn-helix domain